MNSTEQSAAREPQLIFPALAGFYDRVRDLAWPVIRLTVGGVLLVHGIAKLMAPIDQFTGRLSRIMDPSLTLPAAYAVIFLETVGALCIMAGVWTRLFAAALVIEFAVITFMVHFPRGFGWITQGGGWEYPFLWGMIFAAIALRGGGPYSLDRRIGKEI